MKRSPALLAAMLLAPLAALHAADAIPVQPPFNDPKAPGSLDADKDSKVVPLERMKQVYGEDKQNGITGDPQVVMIGDLWVMFYFGAFWRPGAFDTFACSTDLVHWTQWTGPDLVQSSEPWDKTYAHKPWIVKHDGVVYHFYCAVGDLGRVIGLATSKDLRDESKRGNKP